MVEHSQTCEGPITESELLNALKVMSTNKSPGTDGLRKEFYETCWEDKNEPLCESMTKPYQNGELSTSQKQTVIKHLEKRIRTRN